MVSDAEAVSLVAELLDHPQRLRIFVDIERHTVAWEIDFFKALGDAHEGYLATDAETVERLDRRTQLSLAAVDHHQLRQRLPLFEQTAVTACEHLNHRGKIVGSFHGLDVEMAVVALRRLAVFKHHARCHRIRALNVGVVETFDVAREFAEAEILLHAREQTSDALLGIEFLGILYFVHLVLPCVLQRYVEQTALIAPLRDDEFTVFRRAVGQEWHHHRLCRIAEFTIGFGDGIRENLFGRLVEFFAKFEGGALHHRSVTHVHIVDKSEVVVRLVGINIDIGFGGTHHHRFCLVALDDLVFSFQFLRLLKTEFGGEALHLRHEVVRHRLGVAPEDMFHLRYVFPVDLRRYPTLAAAFAVVDVVLQTHTHRAALHTVGSDWPAARTQGEEFLE